MALPFRRRIFVVLVVMTVVPTVLAVAGWVLSVRRLLPAAGARASTERVASTARLLLDGVDTLHLTARERALLRHHLNEVSASVSLARRAETFLRYYTAGFAVVIVLLGAAVLYAAVNLAGHLSRQLSRPIDELVGWTQLIRRHEPLPRTPASRGAPEFEALRQALRELAAALEAARERELEAERLRAFREVARRVAHEIKNPLTSLRRAFENIRRNAAEPMRGRGAIDGTVTGAGPGGGLAVTIADHGPGIPAELRPRVFEPYFTTKDDGTGLGLALVRVTLEAHRGTIAVGETPGGGATFAIVFPPARS